jgi:hypothetical protein
MSAWKWPAVKELTEFNGKIRLPVNSLKVLRLR